MRLEEVTEEVRQSRRLLEFIERCCDAAREPEPPNGLIVTILPGNTFRMRPDGKRSPVTLHDIAGDDPGFSSTVLLGDTRTQRIEVLDAWMRQFPAFKTVSKLPAIVDAYKTFERIKRLRKDDAAFTDDLAEFRFWRCAVAAAIARDAIQPKALSGEQRTKARTAAKALLTLFTQTRLAMHLPGSEVSVESLNMLEALARIPNTVRPRADKYEGERAFIGGLCVTVASSFGVVASGLVIKFCALRSIQLSDDQIKKHVRKYVVHPAIKSHLRG